MNMATAVRMRQIMRDMEDRPRLGRPKKMHTEEGNGHHDLVCDEKGGLFNTGDSELASPVCLLYNNADELLSAYEAAKGGAAQ